VRSLYLVRHAAAADHDSWARPDGLRPLTPFGWRQALAIGAFLDGTGIEGFWASPTVRCQDTLLPAAHDRGLAVEADPRLYERAAPSSPDAAGALLAELLHSYFAAGAQLVAACSHGNVLPPVLALADPESGKRCPKGGVWKLDLDDGEDRVSKVSFLGRLDPHTESWEVR
jgi:broad specificity phosphatase PhoE